MEFSDEYSQEYHKERKAILVKCKICQIWVDTVEQFNAHRKGQKHIKLYDKQKALASYKAALQMRECLESNITNNYSNLNSEMTTISLHNKEPNQIIIPSMRLYNKTEHMHENEYCREFNQERNIYLVKCKVCQIWCDTMDQFFIHQKSSKHIKKAEKHNYINVELPESSSTDSFPSTPSGSTMSSLFCQICNLNCNTEEQLKTHFSGQSHKKKSLKYEYKDWKSAEIPCSLSPDNISQCSEPVISESNYSLASESIIEKGDKAIQSSSHLSESQIKKLLTPDRSLNSICCKLCNQITNTDEQYLMHCNGTKHIRKMKNLNIPATNTRDEGENLDWEMKYCDVCKIRINANNMESHEKGKSHKEKLVKMTHVLQESGKLLKKRNISPTCEHIKSLQLKPRNYQVEVYEKSLKSDCVIFLPTGTGKTFVASMIILKILEENPHHRVAFLVDKVLLVMQQTDFFKEQFENISMKRFHEDGETNRKMRLIGLASSYVNTEHSFSVRDHDVVVATAELFRGLLVNKQLFWEEFGLVILDEAHHCVKEHPYNRLLREYQLFPEHIRAPDTSDTPLTSQNEPPKVSEDKLELWKERRCKLIGLTASPAGDIDKEMTHKLLLKLLESLGGVDIVNVTENKQELDSYTSNSNIETKLLDYTQNEANLREVLKNAFFHMIGRFERFITLNSSLLVIKDCRTLTVEDVSEFKSHLKSRLLETESLQKATINHILNVLNIIDDVDSFGFETAWLQLKELLDDQNEKVWLQNNAISFVPQTEDIVSKNCPENSSVIQAIIDEANSVSSESRTILVLVRERETAHRFEKVLKKQCENQRLVLLVGHGAGKSKKEGKGMSVTKQKKALNLIKGQSNQIIVATSVADEGIDLPECDLVILVNPPSSVQALVQVRGRARKKSSRLLMLCRDKRSIEELHLLQVKEKNIIESIERILATRTTARDEL